MPLDAPLPAYAVVYRQTADGRWRAAMVDVPGVKAEGADIDDVKNRIAAKGRSYLTRVGRDAVAASTSVVGYIHIDSRPEIDRDTDTPPTLF